MIVEKNIPTCKKVIDWLGENLMESNNGIQKDQIKEKPKILQLPNGPYYLLNDMEPKLVENLQNSKGQLMKNTATILVTKPASRNIPDMMSLRER